MTFNQNPFWHFEVILSFESLFWFFPLYVLHPQSKALLWGVPQRQRRKGSRQGSWVCNDDDDYGLDGRMAADLLLGNEGMVTNLSFHMVFTSFSSKKVFLWMEIGIGSVTSLPEDESEWNQREMRSPFSMIPLISAVLFMCFYSEKLLVDIS